MHDLQLFLGIAIDQEIKLHLEKVSPFLKNALIQDNSDYLHEIEVDTVTYLGKKIGKLVYLHQLEMSEKNVRSLLQKLLPEYPQTKPLMIFSYDLT